MSEPIENSSVPVIPLEASVEALLFVASGPVSISQLAEVLEKQNEEIEAALLKLDEAFKLRGGLRLQRFGGRIQLTTAPEFAGIVERFLGLEATARLSRAALEAMAIIAYRQPITRPGVDAIRGVNSDGVLRSLLNKGLIQETGRAEGPGRPILYAVTNDFLQHFGLSSLEELPPLEEAVEAVENNNHLLKD